MRPRDKSGSVELKQPTLGIDVPGSPVGVDGNLDCAVYSRRHELKLVPTAVEPVEAAVISYEENTSVRSDIDAVVAPRHRNQLIEKNFAFTQGFRRRRPARSPDYSGVKGIEANLP